MKNVILTLALLFVFAIPCYAEGLDTLIEVGRSQDEMQKAMNEETKAFERVKRAVETGAISKGDTKASIEAKYGEPVVVTEDSAAKREKWVYKPATSSFFKGVMVYLFFDGNNALDEITTVEDGKKD